MRISSPTASSRALALSTCLLFAPLGAPEAAPASEHRTLDRVVVTANRVEQLQSSVGDSITVIEPDEVRLSQRTMVADLLAATPGVAVSRNGGFGMVTAVRIRGAETDQTVVLLDGVKLNDPSSVGGGYDFGHLLANGNARIEILRGPQSTLWGSQAIGGVVNIVTSTPEGPLSGSLSAEGGERGTAALNARAEAGGERFAWRAGGNYLTTDGISAFDERLGGSEKDGYRNVGFNVRGLLKINDAASAELRSTWNKGRAELDGFPPPAYSLADTGEYADHEEWVAYAGLNLAAFDGRLSNRFGFAYTDTDRENFDPAASVPKTFDAAGRNERWEYQGTLALSERWGAVFGLESETSQLETISAPSSFDPNPVPLRNDVRLDSAYAQLSIRALETLTLTAGLRYDDHETFGDATTGRAALAWSVTPTTLVRASYGEGFKAPTLYQLFSDYGNEALAAEEAEGWDAGIEQRIFGTLAVSATYFSRDTTNMIDFVSCFGSADPRCAARPFGGFYDNVQKTTADGVELGMAAQFGERLRFTANYTGLDAQNAARGSVNFGRALARRPKQTANASLSYAWPIGLTTTVAVQHAGRSFDDPANTIVLDDYVLVDLRATYAVTRSLEIFGRLENAFDEEYQTAAQYGSAGRGLFVGIRQTF